MDALVLAAHDDGPEGGLLDIGGQRGEGGVGLDGALDGVVHLLVFCFWEGGRGGGMKYACQERDTSVPTVDTPVHPNQKKTGASMIHMHDSIPAGGSP